MCDFSRYGGRSNEWLAIEAELPHSAAGLNQDVLELQAAVNREREEIASSDMQVLSDRVKILDHSITTRDGANIESRSYRPALRDEHEKLPTYMHLHGGGFLFGTLASEDAICSRIAVNASVVVLNVNYRHTPKFTYPTAWNDTEDAFVWLHANIAKLGGDNRKVILGGISAGAQLVAAVTLGKHLQNLGAAAQACPSIAGQVLMIPCLVHMDCYDGHMSRMVNQSVSSYVENADAPILPQSIITKFLSLLKVDNPEPQDLALNPGNVTPEQVKGLPPTIIGVAGLDPLRDEGLLYAKMLTEAEVPTKTHIFPGLPHGFRRYGNKLSESKRWDKVIEDGIIWAIKGPKSSKDFTIEDK
ncbi:Alpha/Beta hydrolase protein [Coniella lustricola]|uniref:Alpha/Beta hydrolase protein n=1 Tax=Coniella lustricola TaxID=2025994 RepID=A0A2T3A0G7_9PEZI|nr:Alpha/Beta hydrolase protein [Coniella lustricola]